jgi:hypothetical protein
MHAFFYAEMEQKKLDELLRDVGKSFVLNKLRVINTFGLSTFQRWRQEGRNVL